MALPPALQVPLSLPVVAAPMFIASGPELVMAQCQSGIIGSFPALNARPQSVLGEWLTRITDANRAYAAANPDSIVAPFAVNQIVHRSNDRLAADMETIVEHRVPIVITSLGSRPEINEAVHSYGGIVLHDVIDDRFARKAIDRGADGVIAVAAGAGGHAGKLSPFALVAEIRRWFDGPLLLSGAIATGSAVLAAQAVGADLAYIGSPFLSTPEANSSEAYKQMIVDSYAEDIVYSNFFTGVHGNYLRASIIAAGLSPDTLATSDSSQMSFGANDVKAWRDIWGAGQGIGAVASIEPTRALVRRLVDEYAAARQRLGLSPQVALAS